MEAVLERAAAYTAKFVNVFSNLVVTERYTQEIKSVNLARRPPSSGSRRELVSDFLLLHVGGPLEWRPYRDVYLVDGRPVRDRDERLMRLFTAPAATRVEQAARIARESARYNIGLTERTANTPVLSLLFLQEHVQSRFAFKVASRKSNEVSLDYREEVRPTIIRGIRANGEDTDISASGQFTIEPDTGRVLRTRLVLASFRMRTALTTTYRPDDRFGIAVPAEMREEIELERTLIAGRATYEDFRQFKVETAP